MTEPKNRPNRLLGTALILALVCVNPVLALDASQFESLLASLRDGGNIIYLRHAATEPDGRDSDRSRLDNCSKQRNLSESGRRQAEAIGRGFQHLGIPIGRVYSSPYCRCKETARLAFGDFSIESDLQFSISKNTAESDRLGRRLREMMLQGADDSTNTVFVGHSANLRDGLGVWPKPEGVMVIFKRQGDDLILQGTIHPDHWQGDALTASKQEGL